MSLTGCARISAYLAVLLAVFYCSLLQADQHRGYDAGMLETGQQLYLENCAVCHGNEAQSTVDAWHQRDENGKLPPPPLNGTAHTWHHPINSLMYTVKNGTLEIGGSMPAWKDKLNDEQIFSILIWLTSLWPDEIYKAWMQINEQSQ